MPNDLAPDMLKVYKSELNAAHGRIKEHLETIQELTTMINDVQRVDYIKYRLMQIGGYDRAFRYIVSDLRYKGELEQLFDLPFDEILLAYLSMLQPHRPQVDHVHVGSGSSSRVRAPSLPT
ncbi:unnamed protein product [Phytophthora lilii]|uniref:Unnamed protein product n=1 Tax=Phytophthora lilii TaxID=2077276 RepID=A0A9W6WQ14_9STRA|nr:unnamed protein product [Phytophthora lilii]